MTQSRAFTRDLFGIAFQYAGTGKALVSPDGNWLEVNDAFCRLLGYSREELPSLALRDITHPEGPALLDRLRNGELPSCQIERRHTRKDGSTVSLLLSIATAGIADARGETRCLIVEMLDVSQLRQRESDHDLFFHLSPDLIAISNEDGYFVEICHAWTTTLGWSKEELTSRPFIEFVHPEDRELTLAESRALYSGLPTKGFRNRYLHRDGSYRWLEWSMPTLAGGRSFSIARDITHEYHAAQLQQLQEEKIRILIDNGSDAFIGMNQAGFITEWNRQAENILGWSAAEALGKPMAELIAPERYRSRHTEGIAAFLRTGQANMVNKRVELPVQTKAGKEVLVEMTVGAIKHADQYYFATFMRDISHRKAMEQQLHYQATRDFLTGMPNRYEFMARLERAIRRDTRARKDHVAALLFIDLDGFKQINDALGHDAGDTVLKTFGANLSRLMRNEIDTAARLAGDEFVILLEEVTLDRAKQVAQEVLAAGSDGLKPVSGGYGLGATVGIAVHQREEGAVELLSRADAAMYVAKQAGKNRVALHLNNEWTILPPSRREH